MTLRGRTIFRLLVPAMLLSSLSSLSCRGPASPRDREPVLLVTPEGGPSALQTRLATITPATATANDKTRKLDGALDAFHARTKGRRGYIAVDKPLYQPGETIWFRMFELASASLTGGARDVATFKLVSPRGATVVEKRVLVDDGGAANDFMLPGDAPGGEYVLQAKSDNGSVAERKVIVSAYEPPRIKKKLEFVRKAYGPGDKVMATIALHRATGEPLANKAVTALVTLDGADLIRVPVTTDAKGGAVASFELPATIARGDGLLTILVDDGGVTESIQKRVPITLRDLALALYPEGGELVAGLPGRVYFAAKNALGKPADIEGRVLDDRGELVALMRSHHDGMGRFDLVPGSGRYRVQITRPANIAKTFELPRAKRDGCALQALDDYGSARPDLRVAVWCTNNRDVVVTGVQREQRVATAATGVRAGEPAVVSLAMPAGVQGAVRVTLFDGDLAPLAERLVYRNRGADLRIKVTPDKPTYHPRDPVALAIETTTPDGKPVAADLAVSVVDDTVLAFADDKQATLLARLYLEAEMPGQKIEEPNFYFGPDAKAPAALDLVLGTHGWRRFDWKPVLTAPPKPPIEDSWEFTGEYRPRAKKPARSVRAKVVAAGEPAEAEDAVLKKAAKDKEDAPKAKPAVAAVKVADKVADKKAEAPPPPPPPVQANQPAPPMAPAAMDRMPAGRNFEAVLGEAAGDDDVGGESIEITSSDRRGRFRNRGDFDIGDEHQGRKKRKIRDRRELAEEIAVDPFCCLTPERVFPQPSYTVRYDGPRTDFRETLLWQSRLRTDASGKVTTKLYLSDAVTSFKVAAEGVGGGRIGRGEAQVQSKKPVSLAVKLPLEVSAGDRIRLPVTVANETNEPYKATLDAKFGKAFAVRGGGLAPQLALAANERRSTFYDLEVVGDGVTAADGKITIAVDAANLKDSVERTIRVVPIGFPQEVSVAGTLAKSARHEIYVSDVLPGSMRGTVAFYPSPLATMTKGTEAMIAEPGGCFEQASSTNYPNVMILGYLEASGAAEPALVEKTQGVLQRGYKLLTSYETKSKGYEWFGADPGHEALSAYGLMQFRDMAKVYGDVDKAMVDRTRAWLMARRDGNGGYKKNPRALHTWTADEVTDAYITYALVESGETDLEPEFAKQRAVAAATTDPYVMALATKVLATARPKDETTRAAIKRLAGMQAKDGSFPGAKQSVTQSGGDALEIETTALATLALLQGGEHKVEVRKSVEWINAHRSGWGNYGSTQSTVLALKAMAAAAKDMRRTESAGSITLVINGERVAKVDYEKGHQGAIELDIAKHLRSGKNVVELQHEGSELPYSGVISWGSKVPASNPATKVRVATQLGKQTVKLGEGVRLDVEIANVTDKGVPMTLARIGLPGGLTFQTWQLQELRDKKLVDFYETRPREVILYFRELAPGAKLAVPLDLISTVPGTFVAPASRAYLYYTDEHKHWAPPSTITVTQ